MFVSLELANWRPPHRLFFEGRMVIEDRKLTTIAFVDDDSRVLDGLRRSLRKSEVDLDCHFYISGAELLSDFDQKSFDVVVSDMRMPVMNGAEVLLAVKERSPACLRIILSGYAEDQLVIESLNAAHQYIAKPADADTIKSCIERCVRVKNFLENDQCRARLASIESVPTLPEIYRELMHEISSGTASLQSIGKVVEKDVALSANVLKLVNSAFFALVNHVESAGQAVAIIGTDTIKNLALSSGVFVSGVGTTEVRQRAAALNKSGLEIGLLVSKMAGCCKNLDARSKDHAQIAGMMLGLGELLSLLIVDEANSAETSSVSFEELGSYLLGIWSMPFPVVEAVRWHKHPSQSQMGGVSPLVVVHAAWSMHALCSANGEVDLESDTIDSEYLFQIMGEDTVLEWKNLAQAMLGKGVEND